MPRHTCALLLAAACGTEPDTRPVTADYVIDAILVPACGRAGCHSSTTRAHGIVFDTVPGSLSSMASGNQPLVIPGDAARSRLVTCLTDTSKPMPPDAPLPRPDIDLITRWVTDGAEGMP